MNVVFVFVLIPVVDQSGPVSGENLDEPVRTEKLKKRLFDWLLYLNQSILYGVIGLFVYKLLLSSMTTPQLPLGYQAMILVVLLPPLRFRIMDRCIPEDMKSMQLQPAA